MGNALPAGQVAARRSVPTTFATPPSGAPVWQFPAPAAKLLTLAQTAPQSPAAMPVEAKRLFRPDVLRSHLSGFRLPAVDSAKLDHWAREIAPGNIAPRIRTA